MTIILFILLFVGAATLLGTVLRAKNTSISSSVRHLEDAEQTAAVGRGAAPWPNGRDPFASLS